MKQFLLVFLGGGLGSMLRYYIGRVMYSYSTGFPYGTFIANIAGCLIIGLLMGLATKYQTFSQNYLLLLATGFCGGFTTMSTFALENILFLKQSDYYHFAIYTISTLALGVFSVFLGFILARQL